MDEKRIDELLFEIGNEEIEVPWELITGAKERLNHKPLLILLPLSFLLTLIFSFIIVKAAYDYGGIKYITIAFNLIFTTCNAILALFLVLYNSYKTKENIN